MTSDVLTMPIVHVFLSRVVFLVDARWNSGRVIPLGVLGELSFGHDTWVLGLIARKQLSGDEISCLGPLICEKLANPFQFLKSEFDWAWAQNQRGKAIELLLERNTGALRFQPPLDRAVPAVKEKISDGPETKLVAQDILRGERNEEFIKLLAEFNLATDAGGEMVSQIAA